MINWLQEQYLIWRSARLRKATQKALRQMKAQETATWKALDDVEKYVKNERAYLESKKDGRNEN